MWKLSLQNICTNFSPPSTFTVPRLQQMSPPFDSDDVLASHQLHGVYFLMFLYPERILLYQLLLCLTISLKAKVKSTLNYLLFNLLSLLSYPCPVFFHFISTSLDFVASFFFLINTTRMLATSGSLTAPSIISSLFSNSVPFSFASMVFYVMSYLVYSHSCIRDSTQNTVSKWMNATGWEERGDSFSSIVRKYNFQKGNCKLVQAEPRYLGNSVCLPWRMFRKG